MKNLKSRKKIEMVYALDGKTDGYIAIQTNQDKTNTICSAYNINKIFEGTTRLMIYEELDCSGK